MHMLAHWIIIIISSPDFTVRVRLRASVKIRVSVGVNSSIKMVG